MTSTPPPITATTPPTDEAPQQQQQQPPSPLSPQTQQHEPPPPERPSLYGRGTFRDRASRRGADLLLAGSDPNTNNNKLLPSSLLGISQAALFASKLSAARLAIGNKKKLSSERFNKNNVHHRNVGGYTVSACTNCTIYICGPLDDHDHDGIHSSLCWLLLKLIAIR
jgi:hypothetical protein